MNHIIIILIIFFIGFLFITVDIVKAVNKCPEEKIIYRYIPRTFEEEQDDPVDVSVLFKDMFELQSPWVASFDVHKRKKDINANFVSQG